MKNIIWKIGSTVGLRKTIFSGDEKIAQVLIKDEIDSHNTARLIAAAPEMLKALELLEKADAEKGCLTQGQFDQCMNALKKARGES